MMEFFWPPRFTFAATAFASALAFVGANALAPSPPKSTPKRIIEGKPPHGPDPRIPQGSWDSHLHVLDPVNYPLDEDATYTPGVYTVWDTALFEKSIGVENIVLIQPSIYGTDNSLLVNTLRAVGPERGRGVVVFEPSEVSTEQLEEWHRLGVRGVRVNLVSSGEDIDIDEVTAMLQAYADLIRSLKWVLQLYIEMENIPLIADILPRLDVRVIFDHLGDPTIPQGCYSPYDLKGFAEMVELVKGGVWVKISGAYRTSNLDDGTWGDADPIVRELLKVAPDQVVYASDWPHTRYEGLDIKPWTSHLLDIVGKDDGLTRKLFRDNPARLWNGTATR